jgi:hypothetical protein
MDEVKVVVAHSERATLRVGDVFLKVDADQARIDVEVEAMALAPVPTAEVLWRKPPVLAIAAVPGTALGRLGEPSTASPAAWAAAGAYRRAPSRRPNPSRARARHAGSIVLKGGAGAHPRERDSRAGPAPHRSPRIRRRPGARGARRRARADDRL